MIDKFGASSGIFFLLLITSIFKGWALSIMWGWFMVPTLDLPSISIVQAIGIALVIGYLTREISADNDDDYSLVGKIIFEIFKGGFILATGWIVHLFM